MNNYYEANVSLINDQYINESLLTLERCEQVSVSFFSELENQS